MIRPHFDAGLCVVRPVGREGAVPRDDMFALACLSYELLAGEHPFQRRRSTEARTLKIVPRRPPGLSGRQWKALSRGLPGIVRSHRVDKGLAGGS